LRESVAELVLAQKTKRSKSSNSSNGKEISTISSLTESDAKSEPKSGSPSSTDSKRVSFEGDKEHDVAELVTALDHTLFPIDENQPVPPAATISSMETEVNSRLSGSQATGIDSTIYSLDSQPSSA